MSDEDEAAEIVDDYVQQKVRETRHLLSRDKNVKINFSSMSFIISQMGVGHGFMAVCWIGLAQMFLMQAYRFATGHMHYVLRPCVNSCRSWYIPRSHNIILYPLFRTYIEDPVPLIKRVGHRVPVVGFLLVSFFK